MWELKFNQYNLHYLKYNPKNYTDWIKLYHYYFFLDKKVNHYIMWMLQKESCRTIILEKSLSNEQLLDLLNDVGANYINIDFKRLSDDNIFICRTRDWTHMNVEVITIENKYYVSELQLKEFIKTLFYFGYLDENKYYY